MSGTAELAKALEATLLRPTARAADIQALCTAATADHLAGVVVFPAWVSAARTWLAGSDARVTAVVAYPYGAESTRTKATAADQAVRDGADEIEVVASTPALAAGDMDGARDELGAIVRTVRLRASAAGRTVLVKAVIET